MKVVLYILLLLLSGFVSAQNNRTYFDEFITDTIFKSAHIGISVFDPAANTFLHSYQSEKLFVPASNLKILTCYSALRYLGDSITVNADELRWNELGAGWSWTDGEELENPFPVIPFYDCGTIWTGRLDSVLRPMMYQSDNYVAEYLIRKIALQKFQKVDEERVIDTILRAVYPASMSLPSCADGCGLSRYNLFSPLHFVYLLDKMRTEFGMDRLKRIFPTGNKGTLKNYYGSDNGYIYAKTGSLTGVIALSGYIYGRSNKLLIFSVLVNNYNGPGSAARRRIEKFIQRMRREN